MCTFYFKLSPIWHKNVFCGFSVRSRISNGLEIFMGSFFRGKVAANSKLGDAYYVPSRISCNRNSLPMTRLRSFIATRVQHVLSIHISCKFTFLSMMRFCSFCANSVPTWCKFYANWHNHCISTASATFSFAVFSFTFVFLHLQFLLCALFAVSLQCFL